jgi:hypothetical protein
MAMITATSGKSVTTIEEALAGIDESLSNLHEQVPNATTARFGRWLDGAARSWLRGGCTKEALAPHLPALEMIVRRFMVDELDYERQLIAKAKRELAGTLKEPGSGYADELVAREPGVRFIEAWLKTHGKGES